MKYKNSNASLPGTCELFLNRTGSMDPISLQVFFMWLVIEQRIFSRPHIHRIRSRPLLRHRRFGFLDGALSENSPSARERQRSLIEGFCSLGGCLMQEPSSLFSFTRGHRS